MSDVHFEEFCSRFAADLEIKGNDFIKCPLNDIEEYDSMGKITISLMIESLFSFQISYDVLDNSKDLADLYEYCVRFRREI